MFSVGVLGARSVSGDYSTDLCKHTSASTRQVASLLGVKFLHSTESKHRLDMENLVPAPSGPPCERASAASEFGGLALTTVAWGSLT